MTDRITSSLPPLQPLDGKLMQLHFTYTISFSLLSHSLHLSGEFSMKHTFDSYANWLIPGSVLVGRYPFVEVLLLTLLPSHTHISLSHQSHLNQQPGRCKTREQGEKQLDKILRVGGVDTFLSLQEELPPQDQMKPEGINGFQPYRATAHLIQASLSSSISPEAPPKTLNFLRYPIVDFGLPDASPESLGSLLADLQRRIEAGEKLYIHCWGGRGRAGTIGACLLGKAYGLSADEALLRVQKAFNTRIDASRSPETDEQHQFVADYIRGL